MFADNEIDFLETYAGKHALNRPGSLGDAVRLVAHLGGYRGRKHDPEPGHQIMWHGQTRLSSAALGHELGKEIGYETGFRAGRKHALRAPE